MSVPVTAPHALGCAEETMSDSPTAHHWTINGHLPCLNTSNVAFDRYMRAGDRYGCADQVC